MQKTTHVSDVYPYFIKSGNSACRGELSQTVVLSVGSGSTGNQIKELEKQNDSTKNMGFN